jgi:hypothetical protein
VEWSQIVLDKILTVHGKSWLNLATLGQSVFDWINPPLTWSQFWSLMSQLMWMILKMLLSYLPIMIIYDKMKKEITFPFLEKKEKLAEAIFGTLFFFYFQLPLLIESWSNIGVWCLIILIVANTGTAYYGIQNLDQNAKRNFFICLFTLALLYLYLIGLWFIPMICFQIGFFGKRSELRKSECRKPKRTPKTP